jgi:hypothetical protein
MQGATTLDVPGLGVLALLPENPPEQRFWAGEFSYLDGDRRETSALYLCCERDEPSEAQLTFARATLGAVQLHLDAALALLADRLASDPAFFGASIEQAARCLALGPAGLPFGRPELTFYDHESWLMRFTEGRLPVCDPFGIGVVFQGQQPRSIEDLSEGEPLGASA